MRESSGAQTWVGGFLAALSALLMVNLIFNLRGVNAGAYQTPSAARPDDAKKHRPDKKAPQEDAGIYHVDIHLDELQELDARPLPELQRNPFEFETPKPLKGTGGQGPGGANGVGPNPMPSGAPPPTPLAVPLKVVGYAELSAGKREAYLADDEQVYVVHVNDALLGRFKILRIEPGFVELQDDASQEKVQLVMPE